MPIHSALYAAAAAILFICFAVVKLGNRVIALAHRVIGLMRDWRAYRSGH